MAHIARLYYVFLFGLEPSVAQHVVVNVCIVLCEEEKLRSKRVKGMSAAHDATGIVLAARAFRRGSCALLS